MRKKVRGRRGKSQKSHSAHQKRREATEESEANSLLLRFWLVTMTTFDAKFRTLTKIKAKLSRRGSWSQKQAWEQELESLT